MNTGKYAIITGAASGMGREYTRILRNKGYGIIAVDINADALGTLGPGVTPIVADLSSEQGINYALQNIDSLGTDIEILINNAGIFSYRHISGQSEEYIGKIITLHNICVSRFCRHFLPGMTERGNGYILNISSLSAWMPFPGIALYSSTKSYTLQFSRALATELHGTGVSVTAACFGAVATSLIGLNDRYTALALRLKVMIKTEDAATCALKAMFKRKRVTIPGIVNKIGKPFLNICPEWLKAYIDRKLSRFRQ